MRILYVADGRSPIALAWLEYFAGHGHEVHLVSTRPCTPKIGLASLTVVPVGPGSGPAGVASPSRSRRRLALLTGLRHWVGPLAVRQAAPALARRIDEVRPDLIHALRIPFEAMLAVAARPSEPLVVSVWGNDFTLHAPSTPWMRAATRRTMARADGLHADCRRDLRLASEWGLRPGRPRLEIPGNGGVRRELFQPGDPAHPEKRQALPGWPAASRLVLNPRGLRAYVRTDTFFRAAAQVLAALPDTTFAGVAMAGDADVLGWVESMGLGPSTRLLPAQDEAGMASLFRGAHVSVSPSTHDGTPNTMLEAMACGCVPVAGDLESIREWIVDGENGRLVDPASPKDVARAVVAALTDDEWRAAAARRNVAIIAERADREHGLRRAEAFYREVTG